MFDYAVKPLFWPMLYLLIFPKIFLFIQIVLPLDLSRILSALNLELLSWTGGSAPDYERTSIGCELIPKPIYFRP